MSDIFTYDFQDLDLKESIKLRTKCQQLDTIVLQFNIYNYDIPVDLTNFNIEFRAVKSDGTFYSQVDNITKVENTLTISCNNQLTSVNGKTVCSLRIFDDSQNQKSSYFIVLNVTGIVSNYDRVVSRNLVDILERFDEDVNLAMKLSTVFKEDINEANILDTSFKQSIIDANTSKIALDSSTAIANATKSALDTSITSGNNTKSALDTSTATADASKTALDASITSGNTVISNLDLDKANVNTLNDTLITTIANADAKLQEFENYDTTNLVPLSNIMLNEMYCNKELLSINHNLNGYPIVQLVYTEYGAGVGGAGNFPAGGTDSECNLMQNKTVYTDNNNFTIYVPQNYYIENSVINKINDYKYIVTFTNSTRSILIQIKEV